MADKKHTLESDLDFLKANALHIREKLECDTVHLFISRHKFREDITEMRDMGVGNTLARQKQIEDWVDANDESTFFGDSDE